MERKIKILDCTLRDGGYYNNWDFDSQLVDTYCEFVESSPIDYVEVGYRSIPLNGYLGEYFYCPIYVLQRLQEKMPSKDLVVILNEKDIRAAHVKDLLGPCSGIISMVRVAVDPKNMKRAIELAKEVKTLGFQVAFNVMYMSNWKKDTRFFGSLSEIEGLVDYFYMVDSFGGVMIQDIKETIDIIRDFSKDIPLGFHGHNNLEMAMANTLESIEQGCSIVDATITGMGRGAGNLRMELFLTYLENKGLVDLDFNALSKIVSKFEELKSMYQWGTNLPYMFSGANSLPQKQVMEWVGLNRYPLSSILMALKNQKDSKKDNIKLPTLEKKKKYKEALIIGGGTSVVMHKEAIQKMLDDRPELCLIHAGARHINKFLDAKNSQFYALVGSENQKLSDTIQDYSQLKGICVYPPFPREMGTEIPQELLEVSRELETIEFTLASKDSPLAISIQIALNLGVDNIFFIGFDGYKNEINTVQLLTTQENQSILNDLNTISGIQATFLAPTRYKDMTLDSIYKYIS